MALAIPAQERDVEFTDGALDLLIAESQGYPYFPQEWGYHVWNDAGETPTSEDDVASVRPLVLDQLDRNFFLVRADRLTPRERDYLRAMAELGPGPHRSGDIGSMLEVKWNRLHPEGRS